MARSRNIGRLSDILLKAAFGAQILEPRSNESLCCEKTMDTTGSGLNLNSTTTSFAAQTTILLYAQIFLLSFYFFLSLKLDLFKLIAPPTGCHTALASSGSPPTAVFSFGSPAAGNTPPDTMFPRMQTGIVE